MNLFNNVRKSYGQNTVKHLRDYETQVSDILDQFQEKFLLIWILLKCHYSYCHKWKYTFVHVVDLTGSSSFGLDTSVLVF